VITGADRGPNDPIFQIEFTPSHTFVTVRRQYKTFLDFVSDIGGILEPVILIFVFMYSGYNSYRYRRHLLKYLQGAYSGRDFYPEKLKWHKGVISWLGGYSFHRFMCCCRKDYKSRQNLYDQQLTTRKELEEILDDRLDFKK
jgi:hypothetical protein